MSIEQSQEYRGNGNHEWEDVHSDFSGSTTRLRVPGGWLYLVLNEKQRFTTTFVPMPDVVKHKV